MKNKFIKGIIIVCLVVCSIAISGCNSKSDSTVKPNSENTNVKDETVTEDNSSVKNNKSEESENNIILIDNDNITSKLSENVENPELVKAIIDELNLDEKSAKETRYYYNYVDLNGDGINEIFVQLVGPYTSGTDENNVIIFTEVNGKLEDIDDFTLVHNPIIISNEKTNGYNDIIVQRSGEGTKKEYVLLKYDGNDYSDVNESEVLNSIDNVSGVAIISNDVVKDTEAGKGLYLTK
ncbi:MAG: hypothetical protein E7208_01035 [Clostridium butyricum]|nr:hypothetical protein [Clostridium butyricum]